MTNTNTNTNTYRILRVDLTQRSIIYDELSEVLHRKYLGGRNIILHYLLSEMPEGVDPLSPGNILVFATGTITGLPVGCLARNSAGAKGPLTGGYAEAEAGGYFGAELKRAGLDGICITGCSETPVVLSIHNGEASLLEAGDLWGLDVGDAHVELASRLGDRHIRTALIGPAGENLSRIACIMNDASHAYGRGGLGAVMGSKRLKGIAVKGSGHPHYLQPEKVEELARWFNASWKNFPTAEYWSKYGTIGFLISLDAAGGLPTRNFQEGAFEQAEAISGEALSSQYLTGRGSCYACSVRCKREVNMDEPYIVDKIYGGPEYETAAAFGSNCGVSDLAAIVKANELCNAYGLDTISAGAAIAWAMECYEKGLLSHAQSKGMDLHFGNAAVMIELIEQMARQEGLGGVLSNGAARAAETLGVGQELAMHVKKQDFPMHEPRIKHGLGLAYAVSPTGADHIHAIHDGVYANASAPSFVRMMDFGILEALPPTELSPAKVRMVAYDIMLNTLYNCLVICNTARQPFRYDVSQIIAAVEAVTGWETNLWELMKVAERSITMARVFNLREGLTAADDRLPGRIFEKLGKSPPSVPLDEKDFEEALRLYYEMMGWDCETGKPSRGKLEELGLGWVWEQIANH